MKAYEYRHVVGFEETNLLGNVYYVSHLSWQGRCRELFLRDHAPDVLQLLQKDLRLITTHCSCDYLAEVLAFEEIIVRLRLGSIVQNRIQLAYEFVRVNNATDELVARGRQEIVCMTATDNGLIPTEVPESLLRALQQYAD